MSSLKRLTVTNFRGALRPLTLDFDPASNLTVIYGENASGKSTICDGLELWGRGKVGSLDNRGLGSTSRYWPALGKALQDIRVTLASGDAEYTVEVSRGGEISLPAIDGCPRVEVFRRSQILSLIEAKPSERYAAISRFIDVSGVEASEGSLRELIRDLKKQRDGAAARLDENELAIRQYWDSAGRPAPDAMTWAEAQSATVDKGANVQPEIDSIRALQTAYARLVQVPARLGSAQQAVLAAKNALDAATGVLNRLLENVSGDSADTLVVLEAANAFLSKHPTPSACPVCESAGNLRDLADRVKKRMEAFSTLQSARSQAAACGNDVQRAEQQLQLVREAARQDVAAFEACRSDRGLAEHVVLPASPVPHNASGLAAWLKSSSGLAEEWKKAETELHNKKHFLGTLRQALETWRANRGAMDDLDGLLPHLERSLKIIEQERRQFTDDILASIALEVSRLYESVHPGEQLNSIRLELDPKKRASLEIGADFRGRPAHPQGYFSESHLDTLGLCVFLALAGLDQPENTIVVLDDVLSSADDAHTERLLKLLALESRRFRHCIVTTHHRWKEKDLPGCQYTELRPWSPTAGIQVRA